MARRLAVVALLALLALPARAGAVEPTPVDATIALRVDGAGRGGVLAGARWVVRGTVTPWVDGQAVTVRMRRNGRKLLIRRLAVRRDGGRGVFEVAYRTRLPGEIVISASHAPTPEMAATVAVPRRLQVVPRHATLGMRGPAVRALRARLAALGYVVNRGDRFDERMARAVVALRKMLGLPRTAVADEKVFRRLARGQGGFKVRYPSHGRHVEGDLTHQVLALIDGGRAVRLYPMSSGAAVSPTILGSFRVYLQIPGTNQKGMIHSSFFSGNYAIHGFVDVPIYPASHGCLRVPPDEALSIFRWIRIGTRVDTYHR